MNNCDTKTFKLGAGKLLDTIEHTPGWWSNEWSWKLLWWEKKWHPAAIELEHIYELIIIDENGNDIAQVNPDDFLYKIKFSKGKMPGESLVYGSNKSYYSKNDLYNDLYGEIKELSIKLKDGEFVITNDNYSDSTPLVLSWDIMDVTPYGEKVLSECSGPVIKYNAPTSNDDDYSSDHSIDNNDQNTNEDQGVPYSPMDSTGL